MTTWRQEVDLASRSHKHAAGRLRRIGWRLTIPSVVLSTIVGTALFATLEKYISIYVQVIAASVSFGAAVLTTLLSVLRFSERAELHRTIAAEYRSVGVEITTFLDEYDASDRQMTEQDAKAAIDLIRKRITDIDQRAPELDSRDERAIVLSAGARSSGSTTSLAGASDVQAELHRQ